MPRIAKCIQCGRNREHYAKGLCGLCYIRQYERPPVNCVSCGKFKPHTARGLCRYCYNLQRPKKKNRVVICRTCGEEKEVHAKGLCKACYNFAWDTMHPDATRLRRQRYYEAHKDEWKENNKRWKRDNPDFCRLAGARRRARKAALPDTLTGEQMQQKLSIGYCFYCGKEVKLTLDHFVALGAESNQACGTTLANSVMACKSCNSSKGVKLPSEFLVQLELASWQ